MTQKIFSPLYEKAVYDLVKTGLLFKGGREKVYITAAKECIDQFSGWEQSFGIRYAIKQIKGVYVEALRLTSGLSPVSATDVWLKRDRRTGFPLAFKHNQKLLESNSIESRISLSFLRAVDAIELEAVHDLTNVVKPSEGNSNVVANNAVISNFLKQSKFARYIKRQFSHFRIQNIENTSFMPMHCTTKAGIGGPSCLTAGYQLMALTESFEDDLHELDAELREDGYRDIIDQNRRWFKEHGDPLYKRKQLSKKQITRMGTFLGKISFISDKAGKTRLVAIGNYWVQDVLFQLHKIIYSVLRTIPMDGTYEQTAQFDRVLLASRFGPVWSYDLSAATDRFPLTFQVIVLNYLQSGLGDKWLKVLSQINFDADSKEIFYKVGQPMGLYSSWAVFTLCHHYLIQLCAFQEKRPYPFQEYAILGDDVSIWEESTALRYKSWIGILDVTISKLKSFEPELGQNGPSVAEFAKRVSKRGEEISAISAPQNSSSWCNIQEFPELIRWLHSRRYPTGLIPMSKILSSFNITKEGRLDCLCSFKVWSIITRIPIRGLDELCPNWLKSITEKQILQVRINQFLKEGEFTWISEESIRADRARLDKALGSSTPNFHYFRKMKYTRLMAFMAQWDRMTRLQSLLMQSDDYESSPIFLQNGGPELLGNLDEMEYITEVSFQKLLDGFEDHKSYKRKRAEYVTKLSKLVIKQYRPK